MDNNPKGRPVRPPTANIGRNARAKSMGVLKRIEPPHRLMIRQPKMATEGMEMIMVVVMKKVLSVVFMPLINM